jgi:GGDEF domain-containing protein
MKTFLQEKNHSIIQSRSLVSFDGDHGIKREENFNEMLEFERKRSERSGKPFLLMMLTIFGISDLQGRRDAFSRVAETLSVSSRDTDIKGWYRLASALGVIFTETDTIDAKTLREKIYERLRAHLTKPQVDAVHISFHAYPDDGSSAITGGHGDFIFYPDFHKERSKITESSLRSG